MKLTPKKELRTVSFRIPVEQHEALREISKRTRVNQSEVVEMALADWLKKHKA